METAATVFPDLPFAGQIGADLTVSGPPNRPTALLDLDLADIRERGAAVGESAAPTGQGRLELRDNRGTLRATLKSGTGLSATATGSAPMRFRLNPFELAPDTGGTLEGRVQGQLDLALVPQVVDLYGDSASGRLDADGSVGGSLAKPQLSGEARISDGAYENAQSGTVLRIWRRCCAAPATGSSWSGYLPPMASGTHEWRRLRSLHRRRRSTDDADLRTTRFKLLRRNDTSATLGAIFTSAARPGVRSSRASSPSRRRSCAFPTGCCGKSRGLRWRRSTAGGQSRDVSCAAAGAVRAAAARRHRHRAGPQLLAGARAGFGMARELQASQSLAAPSLVESWKWRAAPSTCSVPSSASSGARLPSPATTIRTWISWARRTPVTSWCG